jgi:hypothetical protein
LSVRSLLTIVGAIFLTVVGASLLAVVGAMFATAAVFLVLS